MLVNTTGQARKLFRSAFLTDVPKGTQASFISTVILSGEWLLSHGPELSLTQGRLAGHHGPLVRYGRMGPISQCVFDTVHPRCAST